MLKAPTVTATIAAVFLGNAAIAQTGNENFDESLCLGETTSSGGLSPDHLVDGFNTLSMATGKPTTLFFSPTTGLHFTETPPMFGYPTLYRMHDDEKWCYISKQSYDRFPKVAKDMNAPQA